MKKFISLVFSMLLLASLQAKELKVSSTIQSVTVYQQGAQIRRQARIYLQKGFSELVITRLAVGINPHTIQVKGKGNFTIMSVYHRHNYLDKVKQSRQISILSDSIAMIEKKIAYTQQEKKAYSEEEAMILSNKKLGGDKGMGAGELMNAANFFRKRLKEIYTKKLDLDYQIKAWTRTKARLQKQLHNLQGQRRESVSEVVVEVVARQPVNGSIELSYLVNNAGWTAEYDLRARDINSPVELNSRAIIHQNTGVDWNKVALTISTGNPMRNATLPELYPWYLYYRRVMKMGGAPRQANVPLEQKAFGSDNALQPQTKSLSKTQSSADYTSKQLSQTKVKYHITIPYTIPSSSKGVRVEIRKDKLRASYRYFCVPKLDTDVFLQARITGWEDLNLLPGNVNIFFEDSYVSKAYLNPASLSDTLDLSLGRDKSIIVKRSKVKDKARTALIGSAKKTVRAWEISVRNAKNRNIDLHLEDQIPLSRQKSIEVELLSKSAGTHFNKTKGILSWDLHLAPSATQSVGFSYQVKYPKDLYLGNME